MEGSCNCGAVCFRINSKFKSLYQCHCSLCQKQSGSTSNTSTIVEENAFQWISGQDGITHWKKDSGFTSHFCSQCGSPVPNRLRPMNYMWIPMGLLSNSDNQEIFGRNDIRVVAHLNCNSKAPWDEIVAEEKTATSYQDMPPSIEDFIQELQQS